MDGTICTQEKPGNYQNAKPIKAMIDKINEIYNKGNNVYIYTARHMLNCMMTKDWLNANGVKYHHIFFGKPAADIYVDDKGCSPEEFISNE
jgi:hypothetical protein